MSTESSTVTSTHWTIEDRLWSDLRPGSIFLGADGTAWMATSVLLIGQDTTTDGSALSVSVSATCGTEDKRTTISGRRVRGTVRVLVPPNHEADALVALEQVGAGAVT